MTWVNKILSQVRLGQWILIIIALGTGIAAFIIGIADSPPGIILVELSIASIAGAWVWNWRSPQKYWTLLVSAILSFPIGVILHNLLYALGTVVEEVAVLAAVISFFEVIFFMLAVLVAGPVAAAALVGGVYTSWQGVPGLIRANRSIRRFVENHQISDNQLRQLINLARLSASGANLQPLKFIISNTEDKNQKIFPTLSWAGYLRDWSGPEEGERPSAYIVILGDTERDKDFDYDAGIACQSITLGAAERGLGGCIIGSVKHNTLRENLSIPERYEIVAVLALGKPAERVVIEELKPDGDIKYWRDEDGVHHVPKRSLQELILEI